MPAWISTNRVAAAIPLVLLVLAALAWPAYVAEAHAELLRTDPANGEELAAAPSAIQLWFSENISPAGDAIRLLDASGREVKINEAAHGENDRTIRAAIPGALDRGTYAVAWTVASVDGHVIRGSFVFAVGQPVDATIRPVGEVETPRWTEAVASAARSAAYIFALALVGALLFVIVPARHSVALRLQLPLTVCAVLLALAAPMVVVAQGLVATAGVAGELWTSTTWDLLWDGRHLPSMMMVLVGSVGALVTLRIAPLWPSAARASAALFAVTLAVGFAWSGHTAAESPQWLAIGMNAVHLLAAGAWAGGLAVVAADSRLVQSAEHRQYLATSFSRMATVAFPIAIVSGTYLTWRILPGLSAFVDTNYGRLLALKIAVLAVAAGLAVWNRWRLLPKLGTGDNFFRRFVEVEVTLVVVTAVVTGMLTGESPRSDAANEPGAPLDSPVAPSFDFTMGSYHVIVAVNPAQHGPNDISVDVHTFDSTTLAPHGMEVVLSHSATDTGPFPVPLEEAGNGRYHAKDYYFPLSGTWTMTVVMRVDEFHQLRESFDFRVR